MTNYLPTHIAAKNLLEQAQIPNNQEKFVAALERLKVIVEQVEKSQEIVEVA